jgi:6-pyruvoyltetrahydropterin/6-carboxytetrahydropterin synthase
MYEIHVDKTFAAAHYLRGYEGECSNLHGHNWKVTAVLAADFTDETGISIDFKTISALLEVILKDFDHKNLNDIKEFEIINPSAELIAKNIFEKLSALISEINKEIKVVSINVAESEKFRVVYKP